MTAMTELDQAIAAAYADAGQSMQANKVWMVFLRSVLVLPINKNWIAEKGEPFSPLSAMINGHRFMLVFDTPTRFEKWAGESAKEIACTEVMGCDVITGIGENIFLALNPGCEFHKEFSPDEIKHLKKVVARIDELKTL